MSSGLLIFLIAAGAVAFFVIGLSLTIIFKGHYMDSEIGENRHMKKRGIRCAAQQMRAEEENLRGECASDDGCAGTGCASCTAADCKGVPDKISFFYPADEILLVFSGVCTNFVKI